MHALVRRRSSVVLLLLALLTPAVLRAAPARGGVPAQAAQARGSFFALLRCALSSLWTPDNGSGADPNGDQLTGDNGSGADPSGLTGDNGSGADPDGRS
jgi:hypothetical protein